MNEEVGVRRKLERTVGKLPELIWVDRKLQEEVERYLDARDDMKREEAWEVLEEEAERLIGIVRDAKAEALEGIKAGFPSGEGVVYKMPPREQEREEERLEPDSFVGPVSTAMVRAMSEFFTGLAHQYPEVVEFRNKGLEGRLLTEDEAHKFLASYAARILTYQKFLEWDIPIIGHISELIEYDPGADKDEIDHRATFRVDPPGVTKTVRYAYCPEGDRSTLWMRRDKRLVPPNQRGPLFTGRMPIVSISENLYYPPFLWPNSLVDNLYDIAEKLMEAFDWPDRDAAAWFVLTGEAPEVRPIDARWETKQGSYLNPQWRIRLTIPSWLPEKEILQAYRLMRRQIPGGRKLPKKTTTLEVARFVWEQERREGYQKRSWDSLREQWNEEHPGHRFETYNKLHKYFTRGVEAIKELNFSWPQPSEEDPPAD